MKAQSLFSLKGIVLDMHRIRISSPHNNSGATVCDELQISNRNNQTVPKEK